MTDPLNGYRGRPQLSAEELVEDEVRAFQALKHEGVDMGLVADLLSADELVEALDGDRPMARLVTHATQRLDACAKIWAASTDPTSTDCMNAHREARAARVLIDWIENVMITGQNAERELHIEAEENE